MNEDEQTTKVKEFLTAIVGLEYHYQLTLVPHQDSHGAFIVEPFDLLDTWWLLDAVDETEGGKELQAAWRREHGFV